MNQFFVGMRGIDEIVVMRPLNSALSRAEALNLAAWLVAVAEGDPEHPLFSAAYNEALNS